MLRLDIDTASTAHLTLDRPERHNAFDEALVAALRQAFTRFASDDGVRAVVLSGAGASFSAGADIGWMRRAAAFTPAENEADALALSAMFAAIDSCPKPVIARVHGMVAGGGVGLVACADMVVAEETSRFRLSEVRLGLTPATISPFVLARIGAGAARRLFLSAELFDAGLARRIGLVHEVAIDRDAAEAQVRHWLAHIRAAAPGAIADAKALIREVAGQPVTPELRALTARRIAGRRASPEGREGLAAFLEKRTPGWAVE